MCWWCESYEESKQTPDGTLGIGDTKRNCSPVRSIDFVGGADNPFSRADTAES